MFNICVIYPVQENGIFDFGYYLNTHMPRSIELLSKARGFRRVSVETGFDPDTPELKSNYYAMCHYYFETLEDFMTAFMPHAEQLQGDIKNYTNVEPITQINEVKISMP